MVQGVQIKAQAAPLTKPLGLLAELTHRCPLGCPYCSNPLQLDPRDNELDATRGASGVPPLHDSGLPRAAANVGVRGAAAAC